MEKLDASLGAGVLTSRECIVRLIREQLLRYPLLHLSGNTCSWLRECVMTAWAEEDVSEWIRLHLEEVLECKAIDMWKLLESLRSVRKGGEWKIEQESKAMRVMYRNGPSGTPFHTYSVEGIINGPLCHALCVIWEVPCFKTWWPQFTVPAFKVLESRCLRRLRSCENVFHTRFKVPWPLAVRELVVTGFALEHLQDDMIIVNLKTVPLDTRLLKLETQGFDVSHLPVPSKEVVRMEANGGFVLQRLSKGRCYLRAIMDLDLKLDLVAPWIINFIGRQLVGHCHRLYHKAVVSVEGNSVFLEAMEHDSWFAQATQDGHVEEEKERESHCDFL